VSVAIQFERVSRKFILDEQRPQSFQELVLNIFHRRPRDEHREFWVLRDISFEIMPGDAVGLIGANGAGKSTLLKLIAGIIGPTSGRILINGRIGALLELGAGFHGDLTGRENIYLNGAILGLSRVEIQRKLDDIIAFAELERFIDMPIRHYSSGMYLRLGFSVAAHTDPEILIVDEALAVGDRSFQTKCLRKISQLKQQGLTIVFVSHSLELVRRLCTSAIWLDHGVMRSSGSVEKVSEAYLAQVAEIKNQTQSTKETGDQANRWGSGEAKVTRLEFLDGTDKPSNIFSTGDLMTIRIHYQAQEPIEQPRFGLAFYQAGSEIHISGPNNIFSDYHIPSIAGAGYVDYCISNLPFLPGDYLVSAAIYDYDGQHPYDHRHQLGFFTVVSGQIKESFGLIYLPAKWSAANGRSGSLSPRFLGSQKKEFSNENSRN